MNDPYESHFTDGKGDLVSVGDRVQYQFGGEGRVEAIFQDGDAYVRFDGRSGDDLVKWKHLAKVPA